MTLRAYFFIALLFCVIPPFAKAIQNNSPLLGKISFPTSANQAAEVSFITGVLFLHNFEYDHARALFQQAEAADPGFALAYWGEAMTYNQPLWNEQDLSAARKVLTKLASTEAGRIEKAKTEREKDLIKAVNLLYGEGDKATRDSAYAEAMRELYQKYPNDDEIAAFYALALMGKTEGARDIQIYMQAAAIAEDITERNPKHPGALHYAIHAYDDPTHAPLGLRAARIYAKIAADASHALHMPSHIYFALGMWDDVIHSNQAAWSASAPNKYTIHDFHAAQWLNYGYLQKKEYNKAYSLVKTIEKIAEASNTPMAKFHYALMRAAYVIESKDWKTDLKSFDMKEMEPASRASNIYTNALIVMHKDKKADISANLNEVEKLASAKPVNNSSSESAHCGAEQVDTFTIASPTGIHIAKITALELQAEIKAQQGKYEEAIKILQQATQIEDELKVGYGPPTPIKPSHELLADILFLNKQYIPAYEEYIKELKLQPNRTLSIQGLKLAEEKIKEQGLAVPEGISPYFNRLMIENKQ